jgi:hypothetical protein
MTLGLATRTGVSRRIGVRARTHSKKQARTLLVIGPPSKRMWIAAIVVAVICVSGLVYGLVVDWNTPPDKLPTRSERSGGNGYGAGLMIGIGAGIAIGSLIAIRRKRD